MDSTVARRHHAAPVLIDELLVVTRNRAHFEPTGVPLIKPIT
jgi:hypothetical protein